MQFMWESSTYLIVLDCQIVTTSFQMTNLEGDDTNNIPQLKIRQEPTYVCIYMYM